MTTFIQNSKQLQSKTKNMLQQFCYQKEKMLHKIDKLDINFIKSIKQTLQNSIKTSTTSHQYFRNIPLRMSCQSIVSVQQHDTTPAFPHHKKLFMKFLTQNPQQQSNRKIIQQMHILYSQTKINSNNLMFGQTVPSIEQVPCLLISQDVKMFDFYCSIWLAGMGYKSQKNKRLILDRLKISIPINQLYLIIVFYQKFGAGFIDSPQRWNLILRTCQNGWEFFCQYIIQFWKEGKFSNKKTTVKQQEIHNKA